MKDVTVVQLQLGRSSSLLTSQRFDGTLANLHHVVELGHGGVLGQVLGHHAGVDRLVGGLGGGVVQGEGAPQAARVVGARHHVAGVGHRGHDLGVGRVGRDCLLLETVL